MWRVADSFASFERAVLRPVHLDLIRESFLADAARFPPLALPAAYAEPHQSLIRLGRALNIDPAALVDGTLHRIGGRNGS